MNTRLRSNYLIQPICNSLKLTAVSQTKAKKKEDKKPPKNPTNYYSASHDN